MTAPNIFANLLCTNVRGPETPLYCLGHEMVSHYPWVLLTWRMGLGVAVMSYRNDLSVSFTGDAGVLPDIGRLAEFLAEDFQELYRAAVPQRERVPAELPQTAPPPAEVRTITPERANGTPATPRNAPAREGGADTEWLP
jgi:hypothetical protein